MRIRDVSHGDLEKIVLLWRQFAREHFEQDRRLKYKPDCLNKRYILFENKLKSKDTIFILVENKDSVDGYLLAHIEDISSMCVYNMDKICNIESFYVQKNSRSKGCGRELMNELFSRLKPKRVKYVFIKTLAKNMEIGKYLSKQGFTPIHKVYAKRLK